MKYLLFIIVSFISFSCSAQSFFAPLPKLKHSTYTVGASATQDSTTNAFRPVANLASFGYANGVSTVMSGGGISYQHLKWDPSLQKWSSVWSINALAWYAAELGGNSSTAFAYGATIGIFNNLILVGAAYNQSTKHWFPTVGFGINLNN